MKTTIIPSRWLGETGRRLDPGPYLSGAIEAKERLQLLTVKKDPLRSVTRGYDGGIYNGPQFSRNYVDSLKYGVPFLGSSSMLLADLSHVPLLRRKDAESTRLKYLRLEEGMTLISCSGTIGRMVYTRPDMAGMWSSQDIMKVVPDPHKIPAGYLYAFLSSRFGVPMVTSSTYGAIIQHIEPEHLRDLPVPRLDRTLENEVHARIVEASSLRANATQRIAASIQSIEGYLQIPRFESGDIVSRVAAAEIRKSGRMDPYFYNSRAHYLEAWVMKWRLGSSSLEAMADITDVPLFKHIYVEEGHGTPFFTSGELFLLQRKAEKRLARRTIGLEKYILSPGTILMARSGQLGGIIGRPQYADSSLNGAATSDHVIRIKAKLEKYPSGFLYAMLATPNLGYPLVTRTACGSSVPALWPAQIGKIRLPNVDSDMAKHVADDIEWAFGARARATEIETDARLKVEQAIVSAE